MKILDPALKAELESQEYIQTILLETIIRTTTLRYTSWSQAVLLEEYLYEAHGMRVKNIGYSSANIVDSVSVDLDDVDRTIFSLFGDDAIGDFPFKLRLAVLDHYGKVIGSVVVFTGSITQWDYVPGKISVVAASIFQQWNRMTTSKFSGSCRWRVFKGIECRYSGSGLSCDRTYSQCVAYNNDVNYGGFRWLPSMVNKRLTV